MRSCSNLTLDASENVVFVSRQGTDGLITTVDSQDGTAYHQFMSGTNIVDAEWGPDYNSDGRADLYIGGRDEIFVADVNIISSDNIEFTILDTWIVADSSGTAGDGTGGRLCFAPNGNLLSSKSLGNNTYGRINVWNPMTGARIASYDASNCKGVMDMIIGPDVDSDGQDDIWIVDLYRGQVRGYDYSDGTYLGIIDVGGVSWSSPTDIIRLPDDTIMISTEKGTSISTGGKDSSYASVVKYDPSTDTASLFLESDGASFACLAYTSEELTPVVPIVPQDYDVIAVEKGDGTAETNPFYQLMTRFAPNGIIVWQPENKFGYKANDMVAGVDANSFYICYQGTSSTKFLKQFSSADGTYLQTVFSNGDHVKSGDWGYDYNGDSVADLYICSRTDFYVLDGTTVDQTTASVLYQHTVADTVYDADSGTSTGTGGNFVTFGPDLNSDGIEDLYVTKGGNSSGNRINVWDPVTFTQIASYPADECRWALSMVFSEDVNSDGREDIWVTDYYRSQIRCYDYMTGAYLGLAPISVELSNPYDMVEAPDRTLYVTSTKGSSLNAGGVGDGGSDIIRINPQTGDAELFYSVSQTADGEEADFYTLMVLPPTTDLCANPSPVDITNDCLVDMLDLEILMTQWLECTDPNTLNCPI